MNITIHQTFLPHTDPDVSVAFYRDVLGFEVRNDVGYGGMRWITVGPAGQPGTSIVLEPPFADPGVTDDERRTVTEMMAKGTFGRSASRPASTAVSTRARPRGWPHASPSRSRDPSGIEKHAPRGSP